MFSKEDKELIFKLIEDLTGATATGDTRQDSLIANLERRMHQLKFSRLVDYLKFVDSDANELPQLISCLTIHTTSWFRENPHFVSFQQILLEALKKDELFKVWCAASSTGEEVYSFALLLEEFRRVHPKFEYSITGTDIDPISLAVAQRAVYPKKNMGFHVIRYKNHVLEGSGKTADFFTLSKEIRDRCAFRTNDLRQASVFPEGPFHVVICRNVLIYFAPKTVDHVVSNLLSNVHPDGYLILGHSESINGADYGLTQLGHSVYSKRNAFGQKPKTKDKYRILAVDDSATARRYLQKLYESFGFECVAVGSGSEATNFLNFNAVDLITLDLKMPDVSGDKWLQTERKEGLKTPVIILSEIHPADAGAVVDLLALGAQHYIDKERLRSEPEKVKEVFSEIMRNFESDRHSKASSRGSLPAKRPQVVLIGASTGGPQALMKLLEGLPADGPPIMITQHMSPKFTKPLAERLCEISGYRMGKVEDHATLEPGCLYLAYGDYHLGLTEANGRLMLRTSTEAPFNGHRPSVDYMFNSALGIRQSIMAILLTGMGRDGALGMRFLRKEGAFCVAQSEEDCVVYGMPREAIEREATDYVGNIDEIRNLLLESFKLSSLRRVA